MLTIPNIGDCFLFVHVGPHLPVQYLQRQIHDCPATRAVAEGHRHVPCRLK